MSNLYAAAEYKNKIINILLKNTDFITLINPKKSECPGLDVIDVLIGGEWVIGGVKYEEQGHVFDYNFADDTTDEEKTFVFVETDIDTVSHNIFTNFNLYVCIFSHKRQVRLTDRSSPTVEQVRKMGCYAGNYGNRIDVLCDVVDRVLNGTDKIKGIGEVSPAQRGYMSLFIPNSRYYGKRLKYQIKNYNPGGDVCGI